MNRRADTLGFIVQEDMTMPEVLPSDKSKEAQLTFTTASGARRT